MYTRKQFIEKIAPLAVEDMRRTGVPASLTIAQACLESADGNSGLTQKANNLFGIKGTGPAGSVTMPTKEYVGGKWITVNAQFRKYHTWAESIADHSKLILTGTRDKPTRYHGVLNKDGKTAAYEVWRGGYATDPAYPQKLISIMDQHNLYKFDYKFDEMAKATPPQNPIKKEEKKVKLEKDWQWAMLRDALKMFKDAGVLNDASWVTKAEKRDFTESELAWLNTIIARRLMEETMLKEGKR